MLVLDWESVEGKEHKAEARGKEGQGAKAGLRFDSTSVGTFLSACYGMSTRYRYKEVALVCCQFYMQADVVPIP